ncbi:MAG TPA: AAA family ATPase [Candidatus Thiothrix moscowensis]|uniref:AAA family ATPase n=1 Tax=unclassified Thiothrix TaxID=2636184 RepID=UPI0025D0AD66|nr:MULTISPECIES: AAA family ATPase [unclassified Thiothrix]HRJ54608.1 AAA family ATPase [Candidatus Thiothrix moscowensis]HRJ95000.1 AAA family ATPase [Candidatus Thiothrix moscowensis]
MIEPLQHLSSQIRTQKLPDYQRFLFRKIDFSQRLIGIMGARGAGKTTLLLQYLKSVARETKVLYVIADHPLVGQHGLFSIADEFQKIGGELLIIDEIHKCQYFERDLKLIFDSYFNLKVIFTGSSATAIDNAKADLSRRAMLYRLPVLSFREFLELETGETFEAVTLDALLQHHPHLALETVSRIKPLAYLPAYLEHGAYPFYREAGSTYLPRLLNASMQVIETDIPALYPIDYDKVNALKKLMVMLCQSEPYDINVSKLCGAVELNQKTLYKYLGLLQAAGLLRLLGAKSSGVSIISKPEKLYLDNTNLFAVFCNQPKAGTLRETFFASMLSYHHTLNYPKSGDFLVDGQYVFEVGGKSKSKKQIKDEAAAWVVADGLEIGVEGKIPLWLFGFLY